MSDGLDGRRRGERAFASAGAASRPERLLAVVADDFGIGTETSRGILGLAARGIVTGSVLIVNSPYAESAVSEWRRAGRPMELGWHPCLTLDRPVASARAVQSLVRSDGTFWPLGAFLARLVRGRVRAAEVEAEFDAQFRRYMELVDAPPALVNSHQHVSLFPPVAGRLERVLERHGVRPYVRRVRESWGLFASVPGARVKRFVLSTLGRVQGRRLDRAGYPGNDWLCGVTDPPCLHDPAFFSHWLDRVPGHAVELACHPGHWDETLIGRDGRPGDGLLERRVAEYELLGRPAFREACARNHFVLTPPSAFAGGAGERRRRAA